MRIVRDEVEIVKMFSVASREAEKHLNILSFHRKYIENPKHIEFRILGDKKEILYISGKESVLFNASIRNFLKKLLQ